MEAVEIAGRSEEEEQDKNNLLKASHGNTLPPGFQLILQEGDLLSEMLVLFGKFRNNRRKVNIDDDEEQDGKEEKKGGGVLNPDETRYSVEGLAGKGKPQHYNRCKEPEERIPFLESVSPH